MNTLKTLFTGKSLRAWLIMAAIIFVPFILCFAFQAPQVAKAAAAEIGTVKTFMLQGTRMALLTSLGILTLLCFGPAIYLHRKNRTTLDSHVGTTALWTALLSIALGIAAGAYDIVTGNDAWLMGFLATTTVTLITVIIPALMAMIGYWFLAVRTQDGQAAAPAFSILLVLWNIECFLIATGQAVQAST
jgi:hypothetical protein